jgi:hypothetical protein
MGMLLFSQMSKAIYAKLGTSSLEKVVKLDTKFALRRVVDETGKTLEMKMQEASHRVRVATELGGDKDNERVAVQRIAKMIQETLAPLGE